jgi:signal recognition particle subunit SRP54
MSGGAFPENYTLDDFRRQVVRVRAMGSVKGLTGKIPSPDGITVGPDTADPEGELHLIEAILDNMTPAERRDPYRLSQFRREEIAAAAGASPDDVASLVRQFAAMSDFLKGVRERGLT